MLNSKTLLLIYVLLTLFNNSFKCDEKKRIIQIACSSIVSHNLIDTAKQIIVLSNMKGSNISDRSLPNEVRTKQVEIVHQDLFKDIVLVKLNCSDKYEGKSVLNFRAYDKGGTVHSGEVELKYETKWKFSDIWFVSSVE